jgi:arginine/lysine/ornithine decarboxylase
LNDRGDELFGAYVARLQKLIFEIKKLKYIKLLETDDISKLVLLVSDGSEFAKRLREIYKIELEMASEKYVIAMTSIGDTDEGYVRFIQALRNLDVEEFAFCRENEPDCQEIETDVAKNAKKCECNNCNVNDENAMLKKSKYVRESMTAIKAVEHPQISIPIFNALNSETEEVTLESSVGRVAGEALCIYPPGINLVNPGEIITKNVVQDLKSGMQHGLEVLGVDENENVKVVAGKAEEGKWRKLHL